jgi:serine/threonine-protein kinase
VGHDGAVRVTDDDVTEDGSAFLVMELLDGEPLEDRRVRCGGQLDEDEVLSVADQLLDVLIAAHAKGVIHRDLKPDNIFVTRTGQVKLLDYGIARLREVTSKSTATVSGATMGTPAFMSPEQARGLWDEVDGRSDLWSVGATMYNLLTGRLVHDGRSTNEQLLHAMTKEPAPLESVLPNASPSVCHLINRALSFEKERRWPDAQRMQEAVRHAYYDRFGKPITTSPRLVVPASVPNRTLADSPVAAVLPRLPTTGQPVETARNATTVPGRPSRSQFAAVLLGGVAALLVTVTAATWVVSVLHRSAATTAGSVPAEAAAMAAPPAVSVAPASLPAASSAPADTTPPVIAASDLPDAGPTVKSPPPRRPSASSTATSAPGIKPNCPPYTIDRVTGEKHFHAECL